MSDDTRDLEFEAWRDSLPATHWARYDLSACRLGWEAARARMPWWLDIENAPKDGTVILAVASQAQTPKARPAWWDGEGWVRIWKSEDFVVDGPRRWWPTHWQHMPSFDPSSFSAPAQEADGTEPS